MLKAKKEELQDRGVKGFTLMEMLIVVAIIAVLIAIAIPTFTGQLENSREATDAANLRSAYADITAKYLTEGSANPVSVPAQQTQSGWQNTAISNGKIGDLSMPTATTKPNSWTLSINSNGSVSIS